MKPMLFRLRSSSTSKLHPKPSLNVHNRIEDLKKISDQNRLILRKLQEVKPSYDHKKWESDNKVRKNFVRLMSQCAGRFTKHPFFINDGKPSNPAATIYLNARSSHKKKAITGAELFAKTMYS